MDRALELELLDELVSLQAEGRPFLVDRESSSPVNRYRSPEIFRAEQEKIFRRLPQLAAHAAELAKPDGFLRREIAGVPLLLTRDGEGGVHAFLNVCRHRNARLVSEQSGCRRRFVCPYHAWTYDSSGRLIGVPHKRTGFPTLDLDDLGLEPVECREAYGLIWVAVEGEPLAGLEDFLGDFAQDLQGLDLGSWVPFETTEQHRKINWKIVVEGGLESYHFKIAHRQTVGRLFEDNLSTFRAEGPHLRSVLARNSIGQLAEIPRAQWRIRETTNLLYSFMPTCQLLVQSDHAIAIQLNPKAVDETIVRMTTLVPKADSGDERAGYWRANHDFTIATLEEDFDLGEGIQAGLASGANEVLRFSRFEGALARFNAQVEALSGA